MSKPSCFVATIDLKLAEKLRADLVERGFALSQPAYTLFSAQKSGLSCTLYTSGKLTVQGKNKDEFISFYLEPEILGSFTYGMGKETKPLDLTARIGVDESGKGDFFGPLCIAGVQADETGIEALVEMGVQDSKNLSDPAILRLDKKIRDRCPHSVVRLFPQKYNELYAKFRNLNRLLAWGHATAIDDLVKKTGCQTALIDQFTDQDLVARALKSKGCSIALTQRTKAEDDPVVAAASILARASFVQGLEILSRQIGIQLPKGASSQVIAAGKTLVAKAGQESLAEVAKLHFKTKEAILGN